MDEMAWEGDENRAANRRRPWIYTLAALGLGVIGFGLGSLIGDDRDEATVAAAPLAVEQAAQPQLVEVETDAGMVSMTPAEALKAQQARVQTLETDLANREAELAALQQQIKDRDAADEAGRVAAQERARAKAAEVSNLRKELALAVAERDQLRTDLKTALADLDKQIRETERVKQRAVVYKKASNTNLWHAFVNNAKVQICEKGSRNAHEKCHEAVDSFFTAKAQERFMTCVDSHQAVPVLRQADSRKSSIPSHSVRLPDDNRFTKKGWYVLYCDPTLPEAVAVDDIDNDPQVFASTR